MPPENEAPKLNAPKSRTRTSPRKPDKPRVILPDEGRARAVVDAVLPWIDGGRFAVKRVEGQAIAVTAHVFTDGHDQVSARLCWGAEGAADMHEVEMSPTGNDEWTASFTPPTQGRYRYTVAAWVDHFAAWRVELGRRVDAADILIAAQIGAVLGEETAARARGEDRKALGKWAQGLRKRALAAAKADLSQMDQVEAEIEAIKALALDDGLAEVAARYPDRQFETRFVAPQADFAAGLPLVVDRQRAAFSAWYEMFPRSAALEEGRHGSFRDVAARLPYVAQMGFDVLYLPPIHPIGRIKRKGRNNALAAEDGDVGSPWAIGADEGGHKDVLPELGTLEDFRALVAKAGELGIELALDIAFQCAPDHPYVKQHPQWFRWRPDGSVQYAENPPKKYQDIYPFNFETEDWRALWLELKSVFDYWIAQGVKIFRVDNPHTKAFPFWEWCITAIKREHPEVLFLAEAFTRPKVMHRLAKLGFSQSYTYFTWRNDKAGLTEYFTELSQGPGYDYFRPNAWPNTPDILNEQLHHAPRAVFTTRLILAATLCANYGIYGPAYELMEGRPRSPGSEEYLDSEKYQLRHWDIEQDHSLRGLIGKLNDIRRHHPALHGNRQLRFFDTGNDQLIAYAKRDDAGQAVLTVVNLDATFRQSGWVHLDAAWLGAGGVETFEVFDLLSGQRFTWRDGGNFVILDPAEMPAHILRIERSSNP
ncbi:alpha-1,4-glucan--maltose-1-phosphate maltosyltransferase [Rhodoferax koreense]|uniref:Alpha-1,4-glucan:maltose-1-phosphate maltosyltransferase n=1 Tax=Rhodoferax koreensis TaxID=1842727 RepID=A0A1P8JWN0_9BURK|nr:alpha-1,4-glucan--maltose-1-phosphate maltosyltransferase [Rhodoferax koreense]APW38157.1 alpha-1,4-glucan--maltose-1-phosphate maltosyltransferase [Rhodoferax koreense]